MIFMYLVIRTRLFIRLISDLEGLARDLESLLDQEQEAGPDDHDREVNHDRVAGAPAGLDRLLFPDLDLVHAWRDLEACRRVAYQSPDQDLDRATEVVQETAIGKDVTRRQSQGLSHGRDQSLRRDLGVDREVNQAVNDHGAMTIRHLHCQGKKFRGFLQAPNYLNVSREIFAIYSPYLFLTSLSSFAGIMVDVESRRVSN